jgi:hypothetical protein
VRDYDQEGVSTGRLIPYDLRVEDGMRYLVFQVWDVDGPIYELSMVFIEDDHLTAPTTHVMRTRYLAIGIPRLVELLGRAGFGNVQRRDNVYFQPVIIGTRSEPIREEKP